MDEGRLLPDGQGGFEYEYFLSDHLGNTRVSFKENGDTAMITQEDHYYPFGMTMAGLSYSNGVENKYLYNGKEFQDDDLGGVKLDWYDYGARYYDVAIGRWNVIDNKAEKYNFTSPYAYALNSPVILIDSDGEEVHLSIKNEKHAQAFQNFINTKEGRSFIAMPAPCPPLEGESKGEDRPVAGLEQTINFEKSTDFVSL